MQMKEKPPEIIMIMAKQKQIKSLQRNKNTYRSTVSSSCHAASTDIPEPLSPPSLSSIAPGSSSRLHPVSSQSTVYNNNIDKLVILNKYW